MNHIKKRAFRRKIAKLFFPALSIILLIPLVLPLLQASVWYGRYTARNFPADSTSYLGANMDFYEYKSTPNPDEPSYLTKIGIASNYDILNANIAKYHRRDLSILTNAGDNYLTLIAKYYFSSIGQAKYVLVDSSGKEVATSTIDGGAYADVIDSLTSSGGTSGAIIVQGKSGFNFAIAHEGTITTGTRPNGNGGAICDNGDFTWIRNNNTVITENKNGDTISEYPLLEATNLGQLRSGHITCDNTNKTLRLRSFDETMIYSWQLRDGVYYPLPAIPLPITPSMQQEWTDRVETLTQRTAVFADYALGIDRYGLATQVWFADGRVRQWRPYDRDIIIVGAKITPNQIIATYIPNGYNTEYLFTASLQEENCLTRYPTGFKDNRRTVQIVPNHYLAQPFCER